MKNANTAVTNLLNSMDGATSVYFCDLITITLADGTLLRYSCGDRGVIVNGNTYALGPKIDRGSIKEKIGSEVATLDITFYPEATDLIEGAPFAPYVIAGFGFDGATCLLERAYSPLPLTLDATGQFINSCVGTITRFLGSLGGVQSASGDEIPFEVQAPTELFSQPYPTKLLGPLCSHTLYDAGCTLLPASFAASATVQASPTPTQISFAINSSLADGYYALGKIVFSSGGNSGLIRTVQGFLHTGGVITLFNPLPAAPAAGDAATIYAGCDKLPTTCSGKFSNLQHFRGEPYIPPPETGI